jgi:hypothetical protein
VGFGSDVTREMSLMVLWQDGEECEGKLIDSSKLERTFEAR